ncbi:hypothetical protein, partial [Nocardioides sp.]|uniref:hypothetical protein n=1 Tax=Nocardioides sp. TaxID=35761 RepID=UPI0031FEF9FF|nr:N-acetylmuramoyl-L-alanine amidase, family 2 [Nocardioides sp.]
MTPLKARYTTACQQLLALGVVVAALTPAASVVSLDVVREEPGAYSSGVRGNLSAYTRATMEKSVVPTEAVDPTVTEYPLTAPTGAKSSTDGLQARAKVGGAPGSTEIVSRPQAVTGDALVGVTWQHGVQIAEQDISLEVRTQTDDAWSDWMKLEYHDDHGPDPDTREARHARPGTDELIVGKVDEVQVRADTTSVVPPDMKLAVVDPGVATKTAEELPALDTAKLDPADSGTTNLQDRP